MFLVVYTYCGVVGIDVIMGHHIVTPHASLLSMVPIESPGRYQEARKKAAGAPSIATADDCAWPFMVRLSAMDEQVLHNSSRLLTSGKWSQALNRHAVHDASQIFLQCSSSYSSHKVFIEAAYDVSFRGTKLRDNTTHDVLWRWLPARHIIDIVGWHGWQW
jgi:hypothetical protein